MFTPPGGAHLDIIDHGITGRLTRPRRALRCARTLHAADKPLRDRLVQAIPLATPTARQTLIRQQVPGGLPGVWGTTGTLGHEAGRGPATPERHLSGIQNQWRLNMRTHRPPHHLACRHSHKDRHLYPAVLGPQRGASATPRHLRRRHSTVALQPRRGDALPLAALGGLGSTTAAACNRPPGRLHHPTALAAPHSRPFVLAVCGQATTAIPGRRLCR